MDRTSRPESPQTPSELGALAAEALAGAWRADPPKTTLSAEALHAVLPHLHATGTSGLAWWAIKDDARLADSADGKSLRDGFRILALHKGLHEVRLAAALDLAASLAIEPLLLKGWSVARAYPSPGLRPCGDVDLAVAAGDHHRLQQALDERPHDRDWIDVDLEHRFLTTDGTPLRALLARSQHVVLDGRQVRVAGDADQLRLVCVHYLRAGGWPLRALCDVALLLETAPSNLDWDVVLQEPLHHQWVTVAAGLAADLLGADLSATPLQHAADAVPPWVRRHVVHGLGTTSSDHHVLRPPFRPTPRPADLAAQLQARWPADGLEATMHHRRPIPSRTPFGNQCFDLVYRAVALAAPVKMRRARRDGSAEVAG